MFPPPEAKEQLTQAEAGKLVAKGEFIHANPSDPIHYGKGSVSVYENVVFLNEDFEVGPGPAFHVYLVPAANMRDAGQVTGTMFVDLGRLARVQGQSEISDPGRRRSHQISERGDLVPAILGADLAGRSHLRAEFLTAHCVARPCSSKACSGSCPNS